MLLPLASARASATQLYPRRQSRPRLTARQSPGRAGWYVAAGCLLTNRAAALWGGATQGAPGAIGPRRRAGGGGRLLTRRRAAQCNPRPAALQRCNATPPAGRRSETHPGCAQCPARCPARVLSVSSQVRVRVLAPQHGWPAPPPPPRRGHAASPRRAAGSKAPPRRQGARTSRLSWLPSRPPRSRDLAKCVVEAGGDFLTPRHGPTVCPRRIPCRPDGVQRGRRRKKKEAVGPWTRGHVCAVWQPRRSARRSPHRGPRPRERGLPPMLQARGCCCAACRCCHYSHVHVVAAVSRSTRWRRLGSGKGDPRVGRALVQLGGRTTGRLGASRGASSAARTHARAQLASPGGGRSVTWALCDMALSLGSHCLDNAAPIAGRPACRWAAPAASRALRPDGAALSIPQTTGSPANCEGLARAVATTLP